MKKFHLALGVVDVEASAKDYTRCLGCAPDLLIPGEYALWRTEGLNLSIRTERDTLGAIYCRSAGGGDPADVAYDEL